MSNQVRTSSQDSAFRYNLAIRQMNAEVVTITNLANEYRKQHPALKWAECIRLAEKTHQS